MAATGRNRGWILALATAVVVPAAILHVTCVAVLGPGTWGSGIEERRPEFAPARSEADQYRDQLDRMARSLDESGPALEVPRPADLPGNVVWGHRLGAKSVYLTTQEASAAGSRKMYSHTDGGSLRELQLPAGHIADRPQWTMNGIAYVRWNPWAIAAPDKVRRYVSSWFDVSQRPEASLFIQSAQEGGWRYVMPGHSLVVAPDGQVAAILRSGALLAGYFSIHLWDVTSGTAPALLSLREHGSRAMRSFRMAWSKDSSALLIAGRTGGFERRGSRSGDAHGKPLALVYLRRAGTLHDLSRARDAD